MPFSGKIPGLAFLRIAVIIVLEGFKRKYTMNCNGVDEGGVVLVVVVVVMVVALVVVVVMVFILVVMVGKRGTTTINFNTLGGGCESCCKGVNSDCFRIAILKYIFGWACCGASVVKQL